MKTSIKYKLTTLLFAIIHLLNANAQKISLVASGTKTSIRGLCVVDDKVIWASGSNGMVAKSTDGGNTFNWLQIPNFEKKDFRDIEAFDSNTAIVIAIAEPAFILKTTNGGKSWNIVFTDTTKGMFLDAISFANNKNGMVIGDPINGKTFIAKTNDGGNSWIKEVNTASLADGEAFFASSGSNIVQSKQKTYFVSGGKKSNLYINGNKVELPITQGLESTGANSIAVYKKKAIIVGGDFAKDTVAANNCVLVNLKTMKLSQPLIAPNGYRSCVVYINKNKVISCGLNGVDISNDAGLNWTSISKEGFHVAAKAKKGKEVFLAGSKGRIAKLEY